MSHRHSELQREWSLYCNYGCSPPQLATCSTQREGLHSSDMLSTMVQRDDMSSRAASSSSPDSLYMPPSPPTLRRAAASSQYTSLCDVPSLDLNSRRPAVDPTAYRGAGTPMGLTYAFHDPPPRGPLRVVNGGATTFDEPCSPLFDGRSRIRIKGRSSRGRINFSDPFATENKSELPRGRHSLQATLAERRAVDADIQSMTRKLQAVSCAEKVQRNGGLGPMANTAWCLEHKAPDTCFRDTEKTSPSLKQQAVQHTKEHGKKRSWTLREDSRCHADTTWHWSNSTLVKNPIDVRSATTTFIEDVNALHSTPLPTAPQLAPRSSNRVTGSAGNMSNTTARRADSKSVAPPAPLAVQESGASKPWAWLQGTRKLAAVQDEDQDAQWDSLS